MQNTSFGPGSDASELVFIDLETTGTSVRHAEICEIGAIRVREGRIVSDFSQLVAIEQAMPAAAQEIHHIEEADLVGAPHLTHALKAFARFLGTNATLCGHSVESFDIPLLERAFRLCNVSFSHAGSIDTFVLAQKAWPALPSYSLSFLRELLAIDADGSHRATKDCHDAWEVFKHARAALAGAPAAFGETDVRRAVKSLAARQHDSHAERKYRKKARDVRPRTVDFDESHPLFGAHVVVSGDVGAGDAEQVAAAYADLLQRICDVGGHPQDRIKADTDYLVLADAPGATKLSAARRRQESGRPIRIVPLDEFLSLFD